MLVTDDGIARLANELHFWKAPYSMLVTDDGMSTLINEPQSKKAYGPMEVVPSGIAIDVAPFWHPLIAYTVPLRDTRVALSWNLDE